MIPIFEANIFSSDTQTVKESFDQYEFRKDEWKAIESALAQQRGLKEAESMGAMLFTLNETLFGPPVNMTPAAASTRRYAKKISYSSLRPVKLIS